MCQPCIDLVLALGDCVVIFRADGKYLDSEIFFYLFGCVLQHIGFEMTEHLRDLTSDFNFIFHIRIQRQCQGFFSHCLGYFKVFIICVGSQKS